MHNVITAQVVEIMVTMAYWGNRAMKAGEALGPINLKYQNAEVKQMLRDLTEAPLEALTGYPDKVTLFWA